MNSDKKLISFVIPLHNEAASLPTVHKGLMDVIRTLEIDYEVLYVDDGSTDATPTIINALHAENARVYLLNMSRNFGKESALAAGIATAKGEAIITLDGDGQHPASSIPDFIAAWQKGAQVVVGITNDYKRTGLFKRLGSKIYYKLYNRATSQKLVPGSSDFRLIDRTVQQVFVTMQESDRMTRGLIDWIGFDRTYVPYETAERTAGDAAYSKRKLVSLATSSFVSMTPTPLYMFGYLGVLITSVSFLIGLTVLIEQIILEIHLTGTLPGRLCSLSSPCFLSASY